MPEKNVWERMTEEERNWCLAEGYEEAEVEAYDPEVVAAFLWVRYAAHGKILAEAQQMQHRLVNA